MYYKWGVGETPFWTQHQGRRPWSRACTECTSRQGIMIACVNKGSHVYIPWCLDHHIFNMCWTSQQQRVDQSKSLTCPRILYWCDHINMTPLSRHGIFITQSQFFWRFFFLYFPFNTSSYRHKCLKNWSILPFNITFTKSSLVTLVIKKWACMKVVKP